jgi:hypothetical protein
VGAAARAAIFGIYLRGGWQRKNPAQGLRGAKYAPLWEETGTTSTLEACAAKRRDGSHIATKAARKPPWSLGSRSCSERKPRAKGGSRRGRLLALD